MERKKTVIKHKRTLKGGTETFFNSDLYNIDIGLGL